MQNQQPGSPPGDRRARPRSPVVIRRARVTVGADVFFGCALNVSRGGLFISAVRHRATGEVHEIRFCLPGLDRRFSCRARVVWNRRFEQGSTASPGFGLQFLDLADEDQKALDQWVAAARDPAQEE